MKVNPNQNVSPTKSLHYNAQNAVSGASQSLDGGCPLRLSLAAGLAGHLRGAFPYDEVDNIVDRSFKLADALIARYNSELQP